MTLLDHCNASVRRIDGAGDVVEDRRRVTVHVWVQEPLSRPFFFSCRPVAAVDAAGLVLHAACNLHKCPADSAVG